MSRRGKIINTFYFFLMVIIFAVCLMQLAAGVLSKQMHTDAAYIGTGAEILWLFFIALKPKDAPQENKFLLAIFIGLPGFIVLTYICLYFINSQFDYSKPHIYTVPVIDKFVSHVAGGQGGSNVDNVIVADWRDPNLRYKLLNHWGWFYDKVTIGTMINITVRDGFLGYQWVESETIAQ